jgi:hypothetical protein
VLKLNSSLKSERAMTKMLTEENAKLKIDLQEANRIIADLRSSASK